MTKSDGERNAHVLYLTTSAVSVRFLRDQLSNLLDAGVQISLATRGDGGDLDSHIARHEIAFEREPHPTADARALGQLVGLIRKIRPTTVTAATPKAGLLGMLAARVCRVPQRVYLVWGLRFETASGWRRRILRLLERLATSSATHVLFNSGSLRDLAVRERVVAERRAELIGEGSGNCVCMDHFDELPSRAASRAGVGVDENAVVIGFVGRLTRDKGIIELVEMFADRGIAAHLLLVGEFEQGDAVPDSIRALATGSENVTHVPWMEDPRVAFSAMDILAFPSYREGLPNVPMEAQRCGVPVVAYAATGTVDAVSHDVGGRLVPVGDTDGLQDELVALVNDAVRRERLGAQGKAFVTEHFDPARCWDHMLHLYTE